MKQYRIYRNIRKKALIFGLSVPMFALQMLSIVGALLVIIFSFSTGVIIGAFLLNSTLYFSLLKFPENRKIFVFKSFFPTAIQNKRSGELHYEN